MTSTLIPRRPVGAFRGSALGFLGGVCAVSVVGFYTLFDKVRETRKGASIRLNV